MPSQNPTDVVLSWAPTAGPTSSQSPTDVYLSWALDLDQRHIAYAQGLLAVRFGRHVLSLDSQPRIRVDGVGRLLFASGVHEAQIGAVGGRVSFRHTGSRLLFHAGVASLAGSMSDTYAAQGRKLIAFGVPTVKLKVSGAGAAVTRFGIGSIAGVHMVASAGLQTSFGSPGASRIVVRPWTGGMLARFGQASIRRNEL